MGIWGTGIYQNDIAEDLRYEYLSLLQRGESDAAALAIILDSFSDLIEDIDCINLFWQAFADMQWKLGRLDESVKGAALKSIEFELNGNLQMWGNIAKQRVRVLLELETQLLSNQPERKRIRRINEYKCEWKDNDIFAIKLKSNKANDIGVQDRYVLVQKVGEFIWDRFPRHLNPIVRLKLTKGSELPHSIEEFDALKYIKVYACPYALRFLPSRAGLTPEEERAECEALFCVPDETGTLPEYQATLLVTSKRSLPKDLIFVGNFGKAEPPNGEFIPRGGAFGLQSLRAAHLEEDVLDCISKYQLK